MEMESTRRPTFDRSREPGLKKPRLAAADDQPNPNGRPFPHRPPPSMAALPPASARYRPSNDNDLSTTEAYQPQPQPQLFHELVSQYKTALAELTFNSKPIITNLTIIAGENLHAAKAVAATICANILEVPSDQKLPSLYLLDSIVKNIGRDYIRYFAARLPEVFCKAYRQVDPPVHASMRHLFGTWKGVFPLQTLQLIEKELGFSPAVNGSGAVSSRPDAQAQRPQHSIHVNPKYLERQRLQQSSSRAKGMASDSSLHGTNSTEDDERLDRASGIDVRPWVDPPAKIHNIQHSRRELLSEPLNEKKIGTVYGDFESGSDVSRNSSLGIGRTGGRVAEPGRDRPWYGAASGITEATAGQRNGLTTKHGFSNHPAPKSSNVGLQLQPTSGIASISTRIASSWKNSEEEEFMWDMHSRLSEQDAAKISMNSRKDWTPDGSEKLDLDDHLLKAHTLHDIGSRFDGETSDYSLSAEQKEAAFGNQLSSPWRLQELQSSDRPIDSGASAPGIGHSDGYSSTLGGLADSAVSSLARLAPRPSLGSSNIGNTGFGFSTAGILGSTGTLAQQRFQSGRTSSPTGQSPMRQPPLSPSFPSHYPQHSAEQNHPQSRSFPQLDYKPPLPSAKLLSANSQLGKGQKLQPEDLKGSSPSGPTFQLGRKYPLSKQLQSISKQSEHSDQQQSQHLHSVSSLLTSLKSETSTSERSNPQATETSGQSSTSSLLAAVMESGILSKFNNDSLPNRSSQDVKQVPSRSNSQPPLRHGPPPSLVTSSGPKVKSASLPTALLHDDASTKPDGSQRTDEPLPLPAGAPPTSTQASEVSSSPISNLLSSLVAKGLISASKSEPSLLLPSQKPSPLQSQKPSITTPDVGLISSAPAPTVVPQSGDEDDVSPPELDAKPSAALSQQSSVKTENLIGLEFKPDVIRELHPPVISVLFEDLPHQCSSCGLRLKIKERLDWHLEWHAWKKAESNDINKLTRRWYVNASDWVAGKAGLPMGIQSSSFIDEVGRMMDEDRLMVPADDDQCICVLCGELFEDYYSEERNEWMFRGATHMTLPQGDTDVGCMNENLKGPIVHACCIPESSNDNMEIETCVKTEKEA